MIQRLYWNTVNDRLKKVLQSTMKQPELAEFRLVGGTALSLQLGHRLSVDIDLFTEAPYGSVSFQAIQKFFTSNYPYVGIGNSMSGFGGTYYVGNSKDDFVKVDVFHEEPFIRPCVEVDNIRLAGLEDITAMKLEVVSKNGRKKDFWDLHMLSDHFDLPDMINFHSERYPYTHDANQIRLKLQDFNFAERDIKPDCLYGKHWELIKIEIEHWVTSSPN